MIWSEVKKQAIAAAIGLISGSMVTGAVTLGTVTVRLDKLDNSFTEHRNYSNERHSDLKTEVAHLKNEFSSYKASHQ